MLSLGGDAPQECDPCSSGGDSSDGNSSNQIKDFDQVILVWRNVGDQQVRVLFPVEEEGRKKM